MRRVSEGDLAFLYHTGSERAIVGIVKIESDPYPDPQADDESIVVFDVSAKEELAHPVSLSRIKESGEFDDWELVRLPRLSVMPVSDSIWSAILSLSRR
jgi:predicted RNA-binding protein with PUA-like domain